MKKHVIATGLILGLVGGAALAGPGGEGGMRDGHGGRMFERMDVDGDGTITIKEIEQRRAERFKQFDADGNGRLNAEELEAGIRQERAQRMLERMDRNKDGAVTEDEFGGMHARMLERLDANDDGTLSKDELRAAHRPKQGKGPAKDR